MFTKAKRYDIFTLKVCMHISIKQYTKILIVKYRNLASNQNVYVFIAVFIDYQMLINMIYYLMTGAGQQGILREVGLRVWDNTECRNTYGRAAPGGIVQSHLCAGELGKDSCSVRIYHTKYFLV